MIGIHEKKMAKKALLRTGSRFDRLAIAIVFLASTLVATGIEIRLTNGDEKPVVGRLPTAEQDEFFERKVRPLLIDRCYDCHSADSQ